MEIGDLLSNLEKELYSISKLYEVIITPDKSGLNRLKESPITYNQELILHSLSIKILELQSKIKDLTFLKNYKIKSSKITLGSLVTFEFDGVLSKTLLVNFSSDCYAKTLCVYSSLGEALLGLKKGDVIDFKSFDKSSKIKILSVD